MTYFDTPLPRLFAHRGASGLRPENTLDAFAAGLEDGAHIIELDVHASLDGHVVVIHDATLDRTTDGNGPVNARTHEELLRLDAGHRFCDGDGEHRYRSKGIRIPTLSEVLDAFPDTPVNIEIKQLDPPIEKLVVAAIEEADARERVLLASGDHDNMVRIRAAAPWATTGFSAAEVAEFVVRTNNGDFAGYQPAGSALQVPRRFQGTDVVTAQMVTAAHALDLEVHVWTINEESEMETLLDLDVDGIMSDFPGRASYMFVRLGLAQRPRGLD